jgi:hypothetical protein
LLAAVQDQSEGQIEGQPMLVRACLGLWALAWARVLAGQALYLRQRNRSAIYGKEKVYGSIP